MATQPAGVIRPATRRFLSALLVAFAALGLSSLLAQTCLAEPKGPPNDDCENAIPIGDCVDAFGQIGMCLGDVEFICIASPDTCPPSIGPCIPNPVGGADCGTFTVDNRLANRDGPLVVGGSDPTACSPYAPTSLQADVWYEFTPPAGGFVDISNCESNRYFDSMVEVYDTCDCSQISPARRVACSDDGCEFYFDDKYVVGATRLTFWTAVSQCYKIRIGGFAPSSDTLSGDTTKPSYGVTDFNIRFLLTADCFVGPPEPVTTYPHAAQKQRYLSWNPAPYSINDQMALRVVHPASGRAYYVSTPRTTPASIQGQGIAYLVSDPDPIPYDWGSLSQVHVTGCMISPGDQLNTGQDGHLFQVHAMCGIFSQGYIEIRTAPAPTNGRWWADVVGSFTAAGDANTTPPTPPGAWRPPDRFVSGFDIAASLQAVAHAATAPHVTWTDISPETPDLTTNGADVLRIVNAFAIGSGKEYYPFRVPLAPGDQGQMVCPPPPMMSELPP
ncbi:MAG: hypothetical protein J5J06_13410 [Phycisphaerae bacterium]|nr:hypothetical protein [Phycisphaerae bacterium]